MSGAALPPAVLLMGPTAAGKTALAVHLAERLPLDVVSVDSAMVYRGMDIGTAKPDAEVLARVPHRLIDIVDPAERYSAGAFRRDALREMQAIVARGRTPLLVGGTMLYFRALQRGLARLPQADPALRAQIDSRAAAAGWPALHQELASLDPQAAARIHPNDAQRIQRALEVFALSGRTLSALQSAESAAAPAYRWIKIAVAPADRAVLHWRIAQRLEQMFAAGFVEEVRGLHARPDLDPSMPAIRAVGYRQVWGHLSGDTDLAAAYRATETATRALARRQMTWLRAEQDLEWLEASEPSRYTRALEQIARALDGVG